MGRIRFEGIARRDVWLDVARESPQATYFHTPMWAEILATGRPDQSPVAWTFRLADDAVAILPLLEYREGRFFRIGESLVQGVYGGPIARRALAPAEADEIVRIAPRLRTARLRVVGNPHVASFPTPPAEPHNFTHVLDLRPGFDEVFRRFHKNHRQSYGYGRRSGLSVRRASTREDFRAYYRVYQTARRRWGERALTDDPFELFAEVHRRDDPNVILWLATLEERIVAGDLWLYWNSGNVGWHGAVDPGCYKLFPANFILTEIIRDACLRGFEWLDFGPSGGLEGVARFKDFFGAERRYFHIYERPGSRTHRVVREVRRRWRAWKKRLPSLP